MGERLAEKDRTSAPRIATDRATSGAVAAAAAFMLLYGFREIFGTDIGTLLALGRDVADRGGVPRTEPLTWTQQGQPFVNSWWLYALAAWKLYELGGTLLLSAISLLTAAAAMSIALERVRLRLVAGTEGGKITVVNPESHEITGRIPVGGPVTGIAVSDKGLAAVAAGGKLVLIDLEDVRKIDGIQAGAKVQSVLLTPDASTLFVGDAGDKRVHKFAVGKVK